MDRSVSSSDTEARAGGEAVDASRRSDAQSPLWKARLRPVCERQPGAGTGACGGGTTTTSNHAQTQRWWQQLKETGYATRPNAWLGGAGLARASGGTGKWARLRQHVSRTKRVETDERQVVAAVDGLGRGTLPATSVVKLWLVLDGRARLFSMEQVVPKRGFKANGTATAHSESRAV